MNLHEALEAQARGEFPEDAWSVCKDALEHIERLTRLGDEMAAAVKERWTGPGGCDCRVCTAAEAWTRERV